MPRLGHKDLSASRAPTRRPRSLTSAPWLTLGLTGNAHPGQASGPSRAECHPLQECFRDHRPGPLPYTTLVASAGAGGPSAACVRHRTDSPRPGSSWRGRLGWQWVGAAAHPCLCLFGTQGCESGSCTWDGHSGGRPVTSPAGRQQDVDREGALRSPSPASSRPPWPAHPSRRHFELGRAFHRPACARSSKQWFENSAN